MTRRSNIALAFTLAAASAAAILAASTVFAHARYKSSTPGTGEVLATSPARVEVTFSQEIQKIAGSYGIEVTRDRGAAVTSGPAVVDDSDRTKLSVPLQPDLAAGRYIVNWKNTSDEDGDPIEGAFAFYVNTQPTTVDLANDAQLAQIGFEEVTATAAAGTPTSGETTAATVVAPTQAAGTPLATGAVASPAPTAAAPSGDDDDGSNAPILAIVALVVVGVIVGFGVWRYTSRRGA